MDCSPLIRRICAPPGKWSNYSGNKIFFWRALSNVPGDLEGDRENVQKGDGAESSGERDYYICEFETRHYNSLKKFARNSEGPKKSATKRVYSAKERSAPRAICLAALQAMALKAVKNVKKTGTGR